MSFRPTILLFLTCAASAWAGSVSLSVEGAADYALKRNPTLAAARLRIEEARGRLLGAAGSAIPRLEIDFSQNVRTPEALRRRRVHAALSAHRAAASRKGGVARAARRRRGGGARCGTQAGGRGARRGGEVARPARAARTPPAATREQPRSDGVRLAARGGGRSLGGGCRRSSISKARQLNVEMLQLDAARRDAGGELRPAARRRGGGCGGHHRRAGDPRRTSGQRRER